MNIYILNLMHMALHIKQYQYITCIIELAYAKQLY